jgi:hypothetical protein
LLEALERRQRAAFHLQQLVQHLLKRLRQQAGDALVDVLACRLALGDNEPPQGGSTNKLTEKRE